MSGQPAEPLADVDSGGRRFGRPGEAIFDHDFEPLAGLPIELVQPLKLEALLELAVLAGDVTHVQLGAHPAAFRDLPDGIRAWRDGRLRVQEGPHILAAVVLAEDRGPVCEDENLAEAEPDRSEQELPVGVYRDRLAKRR